MNSNKHLNYGFAPIVLFIGATIVLGLLGVGSVTFLRDQKPLSSVTPADETVLPAKSTNVSEQLDSYPPQVLKQNPTTKNQAVSNSGSVQEKKQSSVSEQHFAELEKFLSSANSETKVCVDAVLKKNGGLDAIKSGQSIPSPAMSGEIQACFISGAPPRAPQQGGSYVGKCHSNPNPVFSHDVTDVSKIVNIVIPPNIISGDLKTHSYIETDHARVPIYAPVDMTLESGAYYLTGPYRLDFRVSCEVKLRFAHITEPIDTIRNVLPSTPAEQNNSRDQQLTDYPTFKAGDLIGYTTGTSLAGNWDFGVYDSTTKNKYAVDSKYNSSVVYTTAVCPYNYFSPELRAKYLSKFNTRLNGGAVSDGISFCSQ